MAVQRYFALRTSSSGKESSVFTGGQPRQAALKAASRGFTDIYLRERGSKKLHHFRGSRMRVRAPVNRPDWMSAQVWKPNVRKIGVIHLARPEARARRGRRARRSRARTARRARARPRARRARRARRTKARTTRRKARRARAARPRARARRARRRRR